MDRRNGFSPAQLEELAQIVSEHKLSDEQIKVIVDQAAEKAVKQMTDDAYRLFGKTVVDRFVWVIGVIVVAAASWAAGKGLLK